MMLGLHGEALSFSNDLRVPSWHSLPRVRLLACSKTRTGQGQKTTQNCHRSYLITYRCFPLLASRRGRRLCLGGLVLCFPSGFSTRLQLLPSITVFVYGLLELVIVLL